jgi:hypothetical protein
MGNDSTEPTKRIKVDSNSGMETNVDFLNDVLREDLANVSTELFREPPPSPQQLPTDTPPPPPSNFP